MTYFISSLVLFSIYRTLYIYVRPHLGILMQIGVWNMLHPVSLTQTEITNIVHSQMQHAVVILW